MKNKKVIGVIAILVSLNILLLYLNMDLKTEVENITDESTSWGFEQVGELVSRIAHSDVTSPDTSLSLMVFLTDEGCISCVENEVRNLNEFHQEFKDNLHVYIMATDTSYLEQFYITFPVKQIDPNESLLNRKFDFINPVALVTDNNSIVQVISVSEVGKPMKRNQFFRRMASLFQSLK